MSAFHRFQFDSHWRNPRELRLEDHFRSTRGVTRFLKREIPLAMSHADDPPLALPVRCTDDTSADARQHSGERDAGNRDALVVDDFALNESETMNLC